ncbi:hypothetical protein [Actinomycetospora termitidis]|uniref:Uncharacterized protein n=1 Tax=Actinomycetospora termitidis TaxID=3053470 RepID=A0ABT7M157_9PSEU|nr:hypothetical protein [Actinomycetospora sp. Odt1-22]MDL5154396.1 hypothetical protein [Actinomycetospora sp. Odt1-22]
MGCPLPVDRAHWLTCALDGRDHAVVEADPHSGAHLAACARTVWASSLASPPASRCPDCAGVTGEGRSVERRASTLLDRLRGPRTA